jgi:hypothetical protein
MLFGKSGIRFSPGTAAGDAARRALLDCGSPHALIVLRLAGVKLKDAQVALIASMGCAGLRRHRFFTIAE